MTAIDLLTVLSKRPVGLVFDLDATLSPMTPAPDSAQLWPGINENLRRAKMHSHVAILTGRSAKDGARIVNVEGLTYKGKALRSYIQRFELQGIFFAGDDRTDLDVVLEVKQLYQEGLAAMSIIVQHASTLPALLEHGDLIVHDVKYIAEQLQTIVTFLEQQVGEGWLVLAKQDAFLQLHHQYQPLKRVVVLERRYQADDHEPRKAVTQREIAL